MRGKQIAALLALPVIWGAFYVFSQQAVYGVGTFVAGMLIRFFTLILLLLVMGPQKQIKLLFNVKYIWPKLLLIGLLGFSLDLTGFIGLSMEGAATGVALLKCDIIFVNILSMIIYKERFTWQDWTFSMVMLAGVVMVMGIDITQFSLGSSGNIFFILSALFVSINAFVIKSVQNDKRNPAQDNVVAFYNNIVTLICFTVASIINGDMGLIGLLAQDTGLLIFTLLAGLGQTLVYLFYYFNLRCFPVWIVKVCLLLMPVVSAGISIMLFDDVLGFWQYMGIGVVLLGAFGILISQKKKAAAKAAAGANSK